MRPLNDSPEIDPSILALWKIRDRIWEVATAYYPCSLNDARLSEVFPEARIVRLDLSFPPNAVTPEGTIDVTADVTTFSLEEEVDLVFLSNPMIWHPNFVRFVKAGGYAISNDYHNTARQLMERFDFELVGCQALEGEWIEPRIAGESLKRVRTDAEWMSTSPETFEKNTRVRDAVRKKYGAVLGEQREWQSLVNWSIEASERMADISAGIERADEISMEFDILAMDMMQNLRELRLPPRRVPRIDDAFFVFQKVA